MAQSALTVTPPTRRRRRTWLHRGDAAEPAELHQELTYTDYAPDTDFDTYPPPYFDDGAAGALHLFATNTAALASGTGATAGGTEGSYPGAASGAVPASTSVAHEGAGTEMRCSRRATSSHTYPWRGHDEHVAVVFPVRSRQATTAAAERQHASSMSPVTNPALASITPTTAVSGASGTQLITCTGTNFTPGCRIWIDNVEQTTTFASATSLTTTVTKSATAGPWLGRRQAGRRRRSVDPYLHLDIEETTMATTPRTPDDGRNEQATPATGAGYPQEREPDDGRNERQRQRQEQGTRAASGSLTTAAQAAAIAEEQQDPGFLERMEEERQRPDFIERTRPEDPSDHFGQLTRDNVNPDIPSAEPGKGDIVDPNTLGMEQSQQGTPPPAAPEHASWLNQTPATGAGSSTPTSRTWRCAITCRRSTSLRARTSRPATPARSSCRRWCSPTSVPTPWWSAAARSRSP